MNICYFGILLYVLRIPSFQEIEMRCLLRVIFEQFELKKNFEI